MTEKANPRPVPMRAGEIISVKEAARRARFTPETIRGWCLKFGIGRRPGGAADWQISAPALEMVLYGDFEALEKLRNDQRKDPQVELYFLRINLVA